ncbi:hypothetical protein UMM65_00460 [Aureibaculum sp. 2210JD6-5]|uniref:hypothetical protein n=1 Tax=Aureibaculum sp. 2210JD6-5 TaxID=3103957 RepID=UPI002AAC96D0|nr:hypothetical protein [Aureibaculum sp. 2210JD6-5]MDY7393701.1 hypothetical protein [Aureibaculum sp. 2210JD6-5]
MIRKTEHCLLCENQRYDFKEGVYCGITEKKPDFKETCDIINFGKTLEDKILEVNVELDLVKRTKVDTIGHLIIFTLIGIAIIYFGLFLANKYGFSLIVHESILGIRGFGTMVILVSIGISLLIFAIAPLNLYRSNIKIAKLKKQKLDQILEFYKLRYNINLQIKKHWAGHKEVAHELDIYPLKQKGRYLL